MANRAKKEQATTEKIVKVTVGGADYSATFREFKDKSLLGFVSLSQLSDNKVIAFFNDLRVIETKDGDIYLGEPTKKLGEEYKNIYLLPKAIKEAVAQKLLDEKLI